MTAVPTLGAVVLDCPDPRALADFYARLLEWPSAEVDDENTWATLTGPEVKVGFQLADDYAPPTWPLPERPQMFHLDLPVGDLPAAHDRAVGIGARLLETNPTFRVYADPAGHPFCMFVG